jgi:hypothetical protein
MLRGERLIQNQIFVREVNEHVHEAARVLGGAGDEGDHPFEMFCECSRKQCFDRIVVTLKEYEALRAEPTVFAVTAGHESESIEQVVARNERFVTVRKFHPETVKLARESGAPGRSKD